MWVFLMINFFIHWEIFKTPYKNWIKEVNHLICDKIEQPTVVFYFSGILGAAERPRWILFLFCDFDYWKARHHHSLLRHEERVSCEFDYVTLLKKTKALY